MTAEQSEYLRYVLQGAAHLLRLVNDVLDLARVESGKLQLLPEPVELGQLVGLVTATLNTMAAQQHVTLHTRVEDLGPVIADAGRITQVLYNYVSNAIKFNREGGDVWIRIRAEGPDQYRLEVQDTGPGIAPEDLGRLFVEFQQLDAGVASRFPGTGLGLAVTRRVVERHGGTVGVTSILGEGTTFFAILPRSGMAATEPSPEEIAAARILVVHDDPRERAWLTETLQGAGYRVDTAGTGAWALLKLSTGAYDAIMLDLAIPDMNGWQLLKQVRASEAYGDVPVLVVNVNAEQGGCTGYPVNNVLRKPVRSGALLDALERAGVSPDSDRSVLVLEDDEATVRALTEVLERNGYRPVRAKGTEQALELFAELRPAALVLALVMEDMDGFALLDLLSAKLQPVHVPILVLTAKDLRPEEIRRLRAHTQHVLTEGDATVAVMLRQLASLLGTHATTLCATVGDC